MNDVVPNSTVRMALLDGAVVGFVAATEVSIVQLYVRKADRRRGIGARLLAWAKEQSRGSLWLFTFARNAGARQFYEKHGFRIVARGFEPHWKLDDLKYEWTRAAHEVEIRKAVPGEAPALSALALEAKAHWGYARETLESWRAQLQVTSADVASKPTYVGAIDGRIVGFYSLASSGPAWELDNLWVAPPFMHRGVGRALLDHALEAALRGGASSVTVDADPNAEAFYLSCGAVRRGEVLAPIPGEPHRVRPQLAFDALARRPGGAHGPA
jgi:GNAT superfamily N-acetyltransferase